MSWFKWKHGTRETNLQRVLGTVRALSIEDRKQVARRIAHDTGGHAIWQQHIDQAFSLLPFAPLVVNIREDSRGPIELGRHDTLNLSIKTHLRCLTMTVVEQQR